MYRRNGKRISCEPCRISKVRCDHAAPVCARCQTRGAPEKCFYHPAPMTRNNSDFRQYRVEKQQTRPTTRKSKAQVNPPNQKPDGDDIVSDPAPPSYLGFFSTLSLCQRLWPVATPRWSIPPEDKLSKFKAIEPPLRKVMAYSHRLEAIVRQYRDGMHFIVIPQPLLFDPVLLFLQELGTRSDQEAFAKDILKTAKGNLRLRLAPMTPELGLSDFLRILSTERIRLEFLSLVFSLCGLTSLYADVDGFDATAFATEMYNASKYCLKICRSHNQLNDITVWSSFINTMFLSSLFGNASDMAYRWFNEFVSELFILGFHRLVSSPPDGPFFVLETRKRIFAIAVAQDKSISTLLGRPPRIDSRFCDLTLPFDLDDDEVVLDGSRLETALNGLDADGWKCNQGTKAGQTLRPAVLIRLRYRHALLQERVLGLWMTERQESFSETLHEVYEEYELGKTRIPPQYQYSASIWNKSSPWLCVALLVADLSYLYSGFLLDRMLLQASQISPTRLLDKSAELLSGALEFIQRQSCHPELGGRFPWLFLYYGLPGAGTLAAELHQSTLSRVPIQTTVPVSKVVRDLSVLLSYFERERLPDRPDFQVCAHIGKMIGALLDDTLDRGLPDSTQQQHPHQDQELPELSGSLPHDGLDALNLATDAMASQAFLSWFDELIWDYPTADLEPDSLMEPQ
ncbi:hypothetical protein ASPSYDRAFT_51583 [Aspergillus sydowii CBS 593.65]|uniref:Zn(2)-C6 fungal-type domain-containing protein n=1 Tax=Aspergillus sydowii CBS 593.65 TaxID=1036612 RepID=A0A1L9T0B8_9EURO|nr:uncharacterized protein ASPSYDRAFT_51583 [Aspergillus sydowii CBS 593.65]OJJ52912.1 hypothetical protein ASPSYDRAFT_51583 [Aspergillus sydowii CBS 593.65]